MSETQNRTSDQLEETRLEARSDESNVCVVATELALVQCFAIRFLTNPKTIMQS